MSLRRHCCGPPPTPPAPYVCGQCIAGSTPRYFDVTIPRTWAKLATTGAVTFEMPAGTYRCEQQSYLNSCIWRGPLVGSYESFTPPSGACPGPSPLVESMYVAVWLNFAGGVTGLRATYGSWREASSFYSNNFHIQGLWAEDSALGYSVNCKTIDVSGMAAGRDDPGNDYCVEGSNSSYFGYDAGPYRCKAVP